MFKKAFFGFIIGDMLVTLFSFIFLGKGIALFFKTQKN